jgi:hypothetical protein
MASGLGLCVGSVNGALCAHGNGGPAAAVIVEDGRPMCADHRRGYRMKKTVAARASGSRASGTKDPSIGVRCIGSVNGEPCTRDNGGPAWAVTREDNRAMCSDHRRGYRMLQTTKAMGNLGSASPSLGRCVGTVNGDACTHDGGNPAWAVIELDGRAMCAHHKRGYRAQLTNSGTGWVSQTPKGARVLYATVAKTGRPMVKIGKAMTSTLSSRTNAARLSAGQLGLTTHLAATVVIKDRPERGSSGPLSLSYEHAVRLVVASALGGKLGAHKTEWIDIPESVIPTVNWQALLERAVEWVDHWLLPTEGAGCDLLRRTVNASGSTLKARGARHGR